VQRKQKQRLYIRLLVIFLFLLTFGIALTSILNFSNTSKIVHQLMEDEAKNQVEDNSILISQWLNSITQELTTIASSPTVQGMNWEAQANYLQRIIKASDYTCFNVIDPGGKLLGTDGSRLAVLDRGYFQNAIAGKATVSDPIVSGADSSQKLIMVAVPIKNAQGTIVGVLATDLTTEYINSLVADMKLLDQGYGYLVNTKGTLLAHPDDSLVLNKNINHDFGEDLAKLAAGISQKKSGSARYEYENEDTFVSYMPIPGYDWALVLRAPYREITKPIRQQRNIITMVSLGILAFCGLIVFVVSRRITRPIEQLSELTQLLASGNLTVLSEVESNDEVGELSLNFNTMAGNLQKMIREIQRVVHGLEGASEQVAAGTGQASAAIEEVASSANEFASSAEEIEASIEAITSSAQDVSQEATEGASTMEEASVQIQNIEKSTNSLSGAMATLQARSDEIGNIVQAITKVAEQTNLLALNAAIEAARAGEQGRGFAVVAGEIRELAQSTQGEAARISELVENIQRQIAKAQENMELNVEEVQKGVVAIDSSEQAFGRIMSSIGTLAQELKLLSESSTLISQGSEEIAASTEEQTASIEEIAASADELKGMATQLTRLSDEFQIEE